MQKNSHLIYAVNYVLINVSYFKKLKVSLKQDHVITIFVISYRVVIY